MVVGGSQSAGPQGLRVGISSEDSRDRGNRQSWTGKEGALKASIGGRRVVGLADLKCDALLSSGVCDDASGLKAEADTEEPRNEAEDQVLGWWRPQSFDP
jgi:hypothetical protein